jgi:outer membrane protein OmpA-like peptidoglycan-associated protein
MNKSIIVALAALLFSPVALAQDSVDSHGFQAVPTDGDLLDPISLYRAELHDKGSVGAQGLFEYAREPMVLYSTTDGVVSEDAIIQDLTALNLGVFYAPSGRLSFGVSSPLYLSVDGEGDRSGVGLGDIRASGSVGLLTHKEDDIRVTLSAVPYFDIPGFYGDSNLGLSGFAGGGVLALSVGDNTSWDISGNAGVEFTPEVELYNLSGRERLVTGLSAGYAFDDSLALRAEGTFRPTLRDNVYNWTESPLEAGLSLRGHTTDRLGWTVGASHAVSQGISAAEWRVFAGLGLSFGARNTEIDNASQPVRLGVVPLDDDGNMVDLDISITDGNRFIKLDPGERIVLPGGKDYVVVVRVPGVTVEDNVIYLSMPVFFDFDESELRYPEGQVALQMLADALTSHPDASVTINGHTDERGTEEYNQALSESRAETVRAFLVDELGVDPSRLSNIGWGEDWSYHSCGDDEDCHQMERRVDFGITE